MSGSMIREHACSSNIPGNQFFTPLACFTNVPKEKCFIWDKWNINVQHPAIPLAYSVAGTLKTQCHLNPFL